MEEINLISAFVVTGFTSIRLGTGDTKRAFGVLHGLAENDMSPSFYAREDDSYLSCANSLYKLLTIFLKTKKAFFFVQGVWYTNTLFLLILVRLLPWHDHIFFISPSGQLTTKGRKQWLKTILAKTILEPILTRKASVRLVSTSMDEKVDLSKKLNLNCESIMYLPNGVGRMSLKCDPCIPQAASNKYVLYVGRLSHVKGIDILLSMYKKNPYAYPHLLIAGPPGDLDLDLRTEYPNTTYLGFQTEEQLSVLYAKAEALIIPSRKDAFTNVALEAASYCCPILASKYCGLNMLDDAQCLTVFNDLHELSSILTCLNHPNGNQELLRSRAENFRLHVTKNYSWKSLLQPILQELVTQ